MPYLRRVIRIGATDSPNVRLALAQQKQGREPTEEVLVPGVIDWPTYQQRRRTWDKVRQCIGLDGEFYEGAETLLYPPDWLNVAELYAEQKSLLKSKQGTSIGVDTAEGGDKTSWAVCSDQGLLHLESQQTPDTSIITGRTIALMREYGVDPKRVVFDQAGGGQEHADRLKQQGYPVKYVSFGESVLPEPVRYLKPWEDKQYERKERYSYKNRRAQMYWLLHLRLDPINTEHRFGIPSGSNGEQYAELRRQLSVMPLWFDQEGRIVMMPKRKPPGSNSTLPCLMDMLGRSPDEADALVLAVYAMDPGSSAIVVSPMF